MTSLTSQNNNNTTFNFQPNENDIKGILALLEQTQSPDNNVQRQVFNQLKVLEQNKEFSLYLSFILSCTTDGQVGMVIRWQAGNILKKLTRTVFTSLPGQAQDYIVNNSLQSLCDQHRNIRRVSSSIITTALEEQNEPFRRWPNLIKTLANYTLNDTLHVVQGSFYCLSLICEDSTRDLKHDPQKPLDQLIPHFIKYMGHTDGTIRQLSLISLVNIIPYQCEAMDINLQEFLTALSPLTTDANSKTRKYVCKALCELTRFNFNILIEMIEQIITFMLNAMSDEDDEVVMEACEFWTIYCEEGDEAYSVLDKYLPQLLPILINKMTYSDEELMDLPVDNVADAHVADRTEDIAPQHMKKNNDEGGGGGGGGGDEGEDDDDDENNGNDDFGTYTIRKASAGAVDLLSTVRPDVMFPILLPLLEQGFSLIQQHANHDVEVNDKPIWLIIESFILLLGAISDGMAKKLKNTMISTLFPLLLKCCKHDRPLIRSISVWTLTKYTRLICWTAKNLQNGGGPTVIFEPTLLVLLELMQDQVKKVQNDACYALDEFMEAGGDMIIPYGQHIAPIFVKCHTLYQAKNLYSLYNVIAVFAETMKSELQKPIYVQSLLPPLVARWNSLQDDDRNLISVMETLSVMATAMGTQLDVFARDVYNRCLNMIETQITLMLASPDEYSYDFDFLVCALDLLAGIAEGVGAAFIQLTQNTNLIQLLPHLCESHIADIRLSTYALIGEISKHNITMIFNPNNNDLNKLFTTLIDNMMRDLRYNTEEEDDDVGYSNYMMNNMQNDTCNNSIWALGEISKAIGTNANGFIGMAGIAFFEKISRIYMDKYAPIEIKNNCIVTISRFAIGSPTLIAQHMGSYFPNYCMLINRIRPLGERHDTYHGLCVIIQNNPNLAITNFRYVAHALVSINKKQYLDDITNEIKQMFGQIVLGMKQSKGNDQAWEQFLKSCGIQGPLRDGLRQYYGV